MNKAVCRNPWCKAQFEYNTEFAPDTCYKCQSFDGDLSGGVTWTDKKYEGSRFDGHPHEIRINVDRATDRKRSW